MKVFVKVQGPKRVGESQKVPQVQVGVHANFGKFKRQCSIIVNYFLSQSCYTLLSLQILSIQSYPLG